MLKNRPFATLFTLYFIIITTLTLVLFIFAGLRIMEHFFSYYVDKVHKENQAMIVMKASMYYMINNTWKGYDGAGIAEAAEVSGDYCTLTDNDGNVIFTTDNPVTSFFTYENHIFKVSELPVTVFGEKVGTITAGYFADHITSPEAEAFKRSGAFLIILSVLVIGIIGAMISILYFRSLSKPVQIIANVAKDISHGHLRSRISINSNVSEMNAIAGSINQLGTSLLNQEKFRKELTTELSHELRTPLQILMNQVEAILDGIYTADKDRLEAMHYEIARISELLDELENRLMYDNENFDLDIIETNASETARKVATGYEGSFAKKGIAFSYEITPDIIMQLDPTRFAQVMVNLLSNSLKYTESGSVRLIFNRLGNKAVLTVSDTGMGMDRSDIEKMAKKPDYTFKTVHSKGVGMYITKLIVDKHGWTLSIQSDKSAGTTVTVKMSAD